ncbi:PD-(D/E)XK motif protein [Fulvivirga sedimenti]|uniref:PD-(D/E)XK motif protein n=1 Tax=Fulvivirga sedimenti TaxID=2879465 RepID=A0A9X1HNV9_9BACT|nr:PD-(D/E)XK motif protein [Fulvivirga sedimenti]MCA6075598.1 PD-(D/E)XK motif protein [Fulvivirga sedimenti]
MKDYQLNIIQDRLSPDRKILEVRFNNKDNLRRLFSPKLKYIHFSKIDGVMLVDTVLDSLTKSFNNIIYSLKERIDETTSVEEFIELFNRTFKDLIKLASKDKKISINTARGLYGEMLFILGKLENCGKEQFEEILQAWRRPAPSMHDFDFGDYCCEIKTISRKSTSLRINSEYQLEALPNKKLYLKCYRFDNIPEGKKDSLGIIFLQILELLKSPDLIEIFYSKCANDRVNYLGPKYTPLDYEFTLLNESTYEVNQDEFPRIKLKDLSPGLNDVNYNIDLSVMENFKISNGHTT